MGNGTEPVADDELLYRRVPTTTGWYDPATDTLKADAFHPNKNRDVTGISVSRSGYKSVQDAAKGRPGKSYFVAVLRAGDLKNRGIAVTPRSQRNDPGHAELPDLNAANRKSDETQALELVLVELTIRVEGPFPSQAEG